MRRLILSLLAAACCLGMALTVAPAQARSSVVNVDAATLYSITNAPSPCGQQTADGYVPPAIPAAVWARADADSLAGSHRVLPARQLAQGLPAVLFRANRVTDYTLHTPNGDVQAHAHKRTVDVFVPGFRGASCSVWTQVRYTDPHGA